MMKIKSISREMFQKMEETHMLLLMVLAWIPPLFLVRNGLTGLFLGVATVFLFLLLEGSAIWLKKYLNPVLQTMSYLVMLIALSGIMGIGLQLLLFERTNVLLFERTNLLLAACVLEQMTSVYILHKLIMAHQKEETVETKEMKEKVDDGDVRESEEKVEIKEIIDMEDIRKKEAAKRRKEVIDKLLACFEAAVEYLLFLVIVGLLREYVEKWVVPARLLSGGFLLTAALLFLWKLTKTMPERLRKLPRFALNTGLILLVLTGFIGLI